MLSNRNKLIGISELALKIGLLNSKTNKPSTHTLRFWETKFKQLKPTILSGGRRHYSVKDVEVAKMIFFLLKVQGMTINGAKRVMDENLKQLDVLKTSSIKETYYKNRIKIRSKKILKKIKKLNG